jgi:arylsulfatase A-like enzyme
VGCAALVSFALGSACARREPSASPTATQPAMASSSSTTSAALPLADAEVTAAPRASAAPAAAAPALPSDANVLLVSIDSLRADMPWSGYPRPIAPRLAAFEKQSVSYTRAYSISSYTSMSLGGLLGGRYPHELSRDGYFFGKYGQVNEMFPEVLARKGIVTGSAHAHGYFQNAGFEQGFATWQIVPNLKWNAQTDENVTSPELERMAEKILGDAGPKGRFFAWFHFLDPHDQYMSHEKDGIPSFGNKARDKYDAEVLYTDGYVGKLLDFVEAAEWGKRTIVIVTADHGEAFGEHGQFRHGFEIWDNLVHVPLMVRIPGVPARHIDVPRSAVDLAPTVLDVFGAEPTKPLPGKSLVSELLGAQPQSREVVIDLPATSNNDRKRAVISGKWKMCAYGANEIYFKLFDLEADPNEDHAITKGEDFERMRAVYKSTTQSIADVAPTHCGKGCLEGTK